MEIPVPPEEQVTKPQLAAALAAFQAEVPKVTKRRTARIEPREKASYEYDYADMGELVETVLPLLGKHGLAFLAKPTWLLWGEPAQTVFVLVYKLMHKSGEQEVGVWPLPPPSQARPQDLGSAISYGRRYAFQAVTGVAPAPSEDDDAAAAQHAPLPAEPEGRNGRPPVIEAGQKRRIGNRFTEMGLPDDPEVRMAWVAGITGSYFETLDDMTRYEAAALLDELKPAGRQARTDVIGAIQGAGVTEQADALAKLTVWTGRAIGSTADLTVFEAGLAMREAGKLRHAQEEAARGGEQPQVQEELASDPAE
jgi:hypothetical protein